MKKIRTLILPIFVLCNFILFLKEYINTGNLNFGQLCIVFGLTPIAVKSALIF